MIIKTLSVGPLQTNCYVISDREDGQGAVIDPGGDAAHIADVTSKLDIRHVVNTHSHFDHVSGNRELLRILCERQEKPPELIAHTRAAPLLAMGGGARLFGFPAVRSPKPDRLVSDGDLLVLGSLTLRVLHTPGHSPGSISIYCATEGVLFVGDVLFRRGVGRTDLPGGSWRTLMNTIVERLFALPDDTIVYPGHSPPTTIGEEQRENPFLQ